ncbi:MAG: LacI family DNA-binding transcriptional regulator [Kiritimatiellae bacterium]|nr:LacI family DNA-binding transcriptional regulator [Kiritimatiellia bacterium]
MAVTIRDLSRRCGVSTATVSMVLSGKDAGRVGAGQRERILRLAGELGYRSNPIAKGLAKGRTYRIGLVVEGNLADHAIFGQYSFYDRLGRLATRFQAHGYSMQIVQVDSARKRAEGRRALLGEAVDGYVFLDWSEAALSPLLRALKQKRVPAVVTGTTLRQKGHAWTDVDRAAAFADAVTRLVGAGHRTMALLDCAVNPRFLPLKRKAFVGTVRRELHVNAADWVFVPAEVSYPAMVALAQNAVQRMDGTRAFLLTDHLYADAVLYGLERSGLTPGRDCRVIGFGDSALADRCRPRLSHYGLQIEAQVEFCVHELLQQLGAPRGYRPRRRLLGPAYIERET